MGHLRKSILIQAPIEAVWDFITRTSRLTDWAAEEVHSATTDQMVLGTTWTEKMHIAGAPLETTWCIHTIRPPYKLVFVGTSTGGGQARGSHTLTPQPEGTELVTDVEYTLPGAVLGRMLDRLVMERKTEGDIEAMLRKAKTHLEAAGSVGPLSS